MIAPFPCTNDIWHIYSMIECHSNRHYPFISYYVLETPTDAELDDIHDEIPEYHKNWSDAVQVKAFALPADQAYPLTKFGIEELREVVLFVAVPCLITAGLAAQDTTTGMVTLGVQPGDRFTYSGHLYDILEWRRDKAWANTDTPITFIATAEKVRREITPYAGI